MVKLAMGRDKTVVHAAACNSRPSDRTGAQPVVWASPLADPTHVDANFLFAAAVKFADLGHATKRWELHERWTERITQEFWALGDKERALGVSISPLCDKERDCDVAKSQEGFFAFVCAPFYEVLADLVDQSNNDFYSRCAKLEPCPCIIREPSNLRPRVALSLSLRAQAM